MTEEKSFLEGKEANEEKRFQEQCFFLENILTFSRRNRNFLYKRFTQLEGQPYSLISKLLGTGGRTLLNITPAQLSILQPKIRLFKIKTVDGKESIKEFIFEDFTDKTDISTLLNNSFQRGTGVGLKSFVWKDMGTNPGDTGKAFEAELTIHFQSVKNLFKEQNGVRFLDLISRRIEAKSSSGDDIQDGKYANDFRILAEVGWSLPNDNSLIKKDLRDAIQNSTAVLFLALTEHVFDFREDGTVELKVKYIGAIEGKMLSADTDVLAVDTDDANTLEILKRNVEQKLEEQGKIEESKQIAESKNKDSTFLSAAKSTFNTLAYYTNPLNIYDDDRTTDDLTLEGGRRSIKEFESRIRRDKIKRYSSFLTELETKNRIFHIDLSKEEIEEFGISLGEKQLPREITSKLRTKRNKDRRQSQKVLKREIGQGGQSDLAIDLNKKVETDDPEDFKKSLEETEVSAGPEKLKDGSHRLNFIYIGDLINTALDIVNKRIESLKLAPPFLRKDIKLFRFLLGTVEFQVPGTGKKYCIPLADIPISLNYFQAFFLEKVIKGGLDKYLLQDFIRDVVSELFLNALSPDCFGEIIKPGSNKMSTSVFFIPGKNKIPEGKRINISNISKKDNNKKRQEGVLNLKTGSKQDGSQFLLIYVSSIKVDDRGGKYIEDVNDGIYHFYVGNDRGLVKNISFNRADIQYLKEARITNSEGVKKGDIFLSEPYNATVSMFGNAIFKPGMKVYIDSTSMGISKQDLKMLPLGGYYDIINVENIIEPGKYETILKLNWVGLPKMSNEEKSSCLVERSLLGPEVSTESEDFITFREPQ